LPHPRPPQLECLIRCRRRLSIRPPGGLNFRSCAEAKKAGFSDMRRGTPGYSANLDRDGDGIACDKVG